jgi:hypothetical protein
MSVFPTVDPALLGLHNALLQYPNYARFRIEVGDVFDVDEEYMLVTSIDRLDARVGLRVLDGTREVKVNLSDLVHTTTCVAIVKPTVDRLAKVVESAGAA